MNRDNYDEVFTGDQIKHTSTIVPGTMESEICCYLSSYLSTTTFSKLDKESEKEYFLENLAQAITLILTSPSIRNQSDIEYKNTHKRLLKEAEKNIIIKDMIKAPALIEPIEGTQFYQFTNFADHIEVRSRIGSFKQLFNADIMRYERNGQIHPYRNVKTLYNSLNNRTTFQNYKAAHKDNQN